MAGKKSETGNASVNNLVDLLLGRKGEKDNKEAFDICKKSAELGDDGSMGRLGRMYRDGIGTEANLDLAIEYMGKAFGRGIKWADKEYIDLLLLRNTEKDNKEAFEKLVHRALMGDISSLESIGRMYREGTFITQDERSATDVMMLAYRNGSKSVRMNLVDMIYSNEYRDHYLQAFEICGELAEENNAGGYGRLARMYRDGWGVNADSNKAKSMMKKAADMGVKWAQDEYAKMF